MKLLFVCEANSLQSQIAEGLARSIFPTAIEVRSAGEKPQPIHPLAKTVLQEIGIDISKLAPKAYTEIPQDFIEDLNYVITLSQKDSFPIGPKTKKYHWPLETPSSNEESEFHRLERFRDIRDQIERRLHLFAMSHL